MILLCQFRSDAVGFSVCYEPSFILSSWLKFLFFLSSFPYNQLNVQPALPDAAPEEAEMTEEFLKAMHHALLQVNVVEGELECPDTGRRFPIKRGVPNLLLNEDEI